MMCHQMHGDLLLITFVDIHVVQTYAFAAWLYMMLDYRTGRSGPVMCSVFVAVVYFASLDACVHTLTNASFGYPCFSTLLRVSRRM